MVDIGQQETLQSGVYCPGCDKAFPSSLGFRQCPDDGTNLIQLAPSADPLIGRTLVERFVVGERLGQGGMGTVYRGKQLSTGREVAIKVIEPSRASDPQTTRRFLRECTLASQLSHPGSITVIDFGQDDDGLLFLVMELIDGATLSEIMLQAPLTLERAVDIAIEICSVLAAAHEHGVIHRDLKPSNIMLRTQGAIEHVIVLDFGLAKSLAEDSVLTQSGAIMGSPAYMPPELASGTPADERTDLYSLGVILYEACTGKPPFTDDSTRQLMAMHLYERPRPPDVPEPLATTIMGLLEKKPESRPQSASEVRKALQRARASLASPDQSVTVSLPPRVEPLTTLPLPTRSAKPWIPVLLVAAAVGVAIFLLFPETASDTPAPAAKHLKPAAALLQPVVQVVPDAATQTEPLPPVEEEAEVVPPQPSHKRTKNSRRRRKPQIPEESSSTPKSEPPAEDFIDPPRGPSQ